MGLSISDVSSPLAKLRTRRQWVRQGSQLVASTLVAPALNSLYPEILSQQSDPRLLAARNLLRRRQVHLFEAEANPIMFFFALLSAMAAVVTILDYFGIRPSFRSSVRYDEAGARANEFRYVQAQFQSAGLYSYTGVSRCAHEANLAALAGCNGPSNASIATQFGGSSTVALTGKEPAVVQVATGFARDHYRLDNVRVARTASITNKEHLYLPEEGNRVTIHSFQTADGGYIVHDPRPVVDYPNGLMSVHVPSYSNPHQLQVIGLKG